MRFKIPEPTMRMINAWRACAEIIESVDMSEYEDIHDNDDDLIAAIDATTEEMRRIADEMESDQNVLIDRMQDFYDKKFRADEQDPAQAEEGRG